MTTTRREWDSNPRTGAARLPPFQGGPLSSLGISPWARRWRRAGESNSQADWSPAVRFRSGWAHHVPRPSLTVHPCCGPDQVRTGGLRLDGATGTPLPYGAVTGTPPGGRTLTTGVRVRHAGHYVRGVLVGAAGLAPARHSEAALQAAAFAARPHPHGQRAWGPDCRVRWHLCTGGWSLRGDVRGTCLRSPCTVPAM